MSNGREPKEHETGPAQGPRPPLDGHRLADDPVSTAAIERLDVGGRQLVALSDGFLLMGETMVGTADEPTAAFDALRADYEEVRLPLGCFFWPGETNVLVDTGFGPLAAAEGGWLIGGNLLHQLRRIGVRPEDVDVVALSHLHADHSGGLGDPGTGEPIYPNATTYIGSHDWEYFVEGSTAAIPLPDYTRAALESLADRGKITLVDGDAEIAPGVRRLSAPGHTPGHSLYVIHDDDERVLLLGDSMYCPQQLTNLDWGAAFDVDPALARATRERLQRDLELHGGGALGCHFPGLIAGRAVTDPDRGTRRAP